ncbi:MAG: phosphatase PAP2 family protein [Beijerinckiaceae bacterium]
MSGLGGFGGGAGADGGLATGILSSTQAIGAYGQDDGDPLATGGITEQHQFTQGPALLANYAPWVRASLYLSEFFRIVGWDTSSKDRIVFSAAGDAGAAQSFYTLERPPIAVFKKQLDWIRAYADQRAERGTEILTQMGLPVEYYGTIMGLTAARSKHTVELAMIALVLGAHVAMIAKHHLACRRPDKLGATTMPLITTPDHNSFPSAHATEAFTMATVLAGVANSDFGRKYYPAPGRITALMRKQAERIAVNRTVAGMHFPVDSWAGAALGEALGELILALCRGEGGVMQRIYDAESGSDFTIEAFDAAKPAGGDGLSFGQVVTVRKSDLFPWLWARIRDEHALA